MTRRTRLLMLIGFVPAFLFIAVVAGGVALGFSFSGAFVLGIGVLVATVFPALAHRLRVRPQR